MVVCILGKPANRPGPSRRTCLMVQGLCWWRFPYDEKLPLGFCAEYLSDGKFFACYQDLKCAWKCWSTVDDAHPTNGVFDDEVLEFDITTALTHQTNPLPEYYLGC